MRGWQAGRLGPYVCADDNCVDSTDVVPIGGAAIGFGSVEFRQYFPSDMGLCLPMLVVSGLHWENSFSTIYNRRWELEGDTLVLLDRCVWMSLVV